MRYVWPRALYLLAAGGQRAVVCYIPDASAEMARLVASQPEADYTYRWGVYQHDVVGIEIRWPAMGIELTVLFPLGGLDGMVYRAAIRAIQQGYGLALAGELPTSREGMARVVWLTDVTQDVGWLRV